MGKRLKIPHLCADGLRISLSGISEALLAKTKPVVRRGGKPRIGMDLVGPFVVLLAFNEAFPVHREKTAELSGVTLLKSVSCGHNILRPDLA
jgi:hypothetical protein